MSCIISNTQNLSPPYGENEKENIFEIDITSHKQSSVSGEFQYYFHQKNQEMSSKAKRQIYRRFIEDIVSNSDEAEKWIKCTYCNGSYHRIQQVCEEKGYSLLLCYYNQPR